MVNSGKNQVIIFVELDATSVELKIEELNEHFLLRIFLNLQKLYMETSMITLT